MPLTERSLHDYLGFPIWKVPNGNGCSLDPGEKEALVSELRTELSRTSSSLSFQALFSLQHPVHMAVLLKRAEPEQHEILRLICDNLRGDTTLQYVAPFEEV